MDIKTIFKDLVHFGLGFSLAAALAFWLGGPEAHQAFVNSALCAAAFAVVWPLHVLRVKTLASKVNGHEGPCVPVWLNRNQIDYMRQGAVTGFFRHTVKIPGLRFVIPKGPEFHGYIKRDLTVASTEGHYSGPLPQ